MQKPPDHLPQLGTCARCGNEHDLKYMFDFITAELITTHDQALQISRLLDLYKTSPRHALIIMAHLADTACRHEGSSPEEFVQLFGIVHDLKNQLINK